MGDFASAMAGFQQRFNYLRNSESTKDELIHDMLVTISKLGSAFHETELTLERERDTARLYQRLRAKAESEAAQGQAKLRLKQDDIDSNAFVAVLIDGDGMIFQDILARGGGEGGQEAAGRLREAVREHIRLRFPDLPNIRNLHILVRVFANMRGLAKAYMDAGIVGDSWEFENFVRGFNMKHALCDMTDAGNGKECSDEKLKGFFDFCIRDVHCKYLIFGGSGDNGYARLLTQYSGDPAARERITMLEGPPFAMELAKLTDKFTTTTFPSVFKNTKLSVRRVSFGQTTTINSPAPTLNQNQNNTINQPPMTPQKSTAPNTTTSSTSNNKAQTWAAISKTNGTSATPATINISNANASSKPFRTASPSQQPGRHFVILRNSQGERYDTRTHTNRESLSKVYTAQPRLCNRFHLLNDCADGEYCDYRHGTITSAEKEALTYFARKQPCMNRPWCDEEKCIFGHECPNRNCSNEECRFGRPGVDKEHGPLLRDDPKDVGGVY